MKRYAFTVAGHPVGAVRMTRSGRFSKAAQRYHDYKRSIQIEARAIGIRLPLRAEEQQPVMVHTQCFFENRRHPDPENVQKGVVDALFYGAVGGDKYVGGSYAPPAYHKYPRVHVVVEIHDAPVPATE